ncbi:MAG TPA: hypothetical protein VJX23_02080, partial [Candidatus Binataceae bacterium]|nr:hypothetical protein [Candidatus Binataceae bacterium]
MKSVERSEGDGRQAQQKIASTEGVPIFQGMHVEKSLRDIVFERGCRAAFRAGVDVAVASAASEKATELDHSETADRYRLQARKEAVELVGSGFAQISLG